MYVHKYMCTLIYIYIYIYVCHLHGLISCYVCRVQNVLHKSLALSSRVYKYANMYIQTACIDVYIHMRICLLVFVLVFVFVCVGLLGCGFKYVHLHTHFYLHTCMPIAMNRMCRTICIHIHKYFCTYVRPVSRTITPKLTRGGRLATSAGNHARLYWCVCICVRYKKGVDVRVMSSGMFYFTVRRRVHALRCCSHSMAYKERCSIQTCLVTQHRSGGPRP